jgi:hypothetical protein
MGVFDFHKKNPCLIGFSMSLLKENVKKESA